MREEDKGLVSRMCAYNKAISEPVRMKMIKVLGSALGETLSVNEIATALDISQPVASKHLQILYSVELVNRERQGARVLYTLDEEHLKNYYQLLGYAFEHKNTPCPHSYKCDICPVKETCA